MYKSSGLFYIHFLRGEESEFEQFENNFVFIEKIYLLQRGKKSP